MYAIVKLGNGKTYTSSVFGYYCKINATDDYKQYLESIHNQFYVVLNEEKTALVKKYIYPSSNKYLDPQILIVDANQADWVYEDTKHGCINFLNHVDFYEDEIKVDDHALGKCVALDAEYIYHEYVEIKTAEDIENLLWVSGGFHDAYIERCEKNEDTVYVLFDGVWGCKIELWFDGDAHFCIDSRDPEYDDPTWYDSTILMENGYIYLVDEGDMKVEDITDKYCWFSGKRLKYHVIPDA